MSDFSRLDDPCVESLVGRASVFIAAPQQVFPSLGERQNGKRSYGLAPAFRVHRHHHRALFHKFLSRQSDRVLAPSAPVAAVLDSDKIRFRHGAEATDLA